MTHVMCNPWKRTFTLAPLAPLTVFHPSLLRKKILHIKGCRVQCK